MQKGSFISLTVLINWMPPQQEPSKLRLDKLTMIWFPSSLQMGNGFGPRIMGSINPVYIALLLAMAIMCYIWVVMLMIVHHTVHSTPILVPSGATSRNQGIAEIFLFPNFRLMGIGFGVPITVTILGDLWGKTQL